MIIFLFALIVFLIIGKTLLNMTLSALGAVLGVCLLIIVYLIRKKRNAGK